MEKTLRSSEPKQNWQHRECCVWDLGMEGTCSILRDGSQRFGSLLALLSWIAEHWGKKMDISRADMALVVLLFCSSAEIQDLK